MSRRLRPQRPLTPILAALLASMALGAAVGAAGPATASARTVEFAGKRVAVPPGWPVYRLAQHPGMCVRLDRRAVYLGVPASDQRCPSAAAVAGRRAILVEPPAAARAALSALPQATASAGGAVFTGLGFDACTAPSSKSMAAWRASSPYEAIGVYIGGSNRGCSQPNLTASWVSAQTAAGWHLIPTYVGLQAPTSACSSCAKLSTSQATAQGSAAATDAVAQAGGLGMGAGSPIYFDMEAYTRTSSATAATLAFLEAWTKKLHALGYTSGVYSSSASGVADLAGQVGTGYDLPDDIWFANWNGVANTSDPYLPANAWTQHQRIHQYRGGHDETYGGVTINIDNNYVDGATVGAGAAGEDNPVGNLDLSGTPAPGQVRVKGWAFDPSAPTQALTIRAFIGGRAGSPNALEYDLGPVANRSRPDIAAKHPEAGALHGFDVRVPTVKSGPQPVCVYAIDVAPGEDRLLACKTTHIPVAVTLSNVRTTRAGVHVRVTCAWPQGIACPGQLALRTRFKVAVRRGNGRPPRLQTVKRSIGRLSFQLTGGRSQAYLVPLSAQGRELLRVRGKLRTQLIAAIPGGRRVTVLAIERR